MIEIEEYILLSKEERQKHLRLDDACIERGGQSMYCKGLLAHILDTTIPAGKKIHVCHACHNAKCSNPTHLYWGTAKENRFDAIDNGSHINPYEALVAKVGIEAANLKMRRTGNTNASGNKGKPKTEEHKRKIAAALRGRKK